MSAVAPPASRVDPGGGRPPDRVRVLVWYFVLAYLLSWAWVVPLALGDQVVRQGQGWPTHVPSLFGPMLAALVVTAVAHGRAGLHDLGRRMVRWRVGWGWWLAAVSPVLMLPVALVVGRVLGVSTPSVGDFASFSGLPSGLGVLGVLVVLLLVNGYGEETGWRGFAVPHLEQRMSPLAAALVVAPLWALWHLPSFFVINSYRTFTAPLVVGWFIGLTCGSIVLTWLYDGSGGSVLLVVVWHALYNLVGATAAAHGTLGALVVVLVMAQAVVLVVRYVRAGRRGGSRPPHGTGWMNRVVNPVVRLGLRTPGLRRVLGRRLAVVGFTGRRSGRAYETPVQYVRDGDTIWVYPGHPDRKVWWHNLEDGGASVRLVVAGEELAGPAVVLRAGDPGFAEGLDTYLRGQPAAAPSVGVDGSPVLVRVGPVGP